MSVVTTQPETLTPVASISNAMPTESSPDRPGNGARTDGDRQIERRHRGAGRSPMEILTSLPAVVVLERFPIPSLAMTREGIILFANSVFAEMVGYQQDDLAGLAFQEVFQTMPAELCALSGVDALANLVMELRHCEGWTVRARMSKSALMRRDDPVVLVTFEDLTDRLWVDER